MSWVFPRFGIVSPKPSDTPDPKKLRLDGLDIEDTFLVEPVTFQKYTDKYNRALSLFQQSYDDGRGYKPTLIDIARIKLGYAKHHKDVIYNVTTKKHDINKQQQAKKIFNESKKHYESALSELSKVPDLTKYKCRAMNELGLLLLFGLKYTYTDDTIINVVDSDTENAIALFTDAIKCDEKEYTPYYNLGLAFETKAQQPSIDKANKHNLLSECVKNYQKFIYVTDQLSEGHNDLDLYKDAIVKATSKIQKYSTEITRLGGKSKSRKYRKRVKRLHKKSRRGRSRK
jgi:hypothetical protein